MSVSVAEIQGWYGPLALSERFIQMLWAEQPWKKSKLVLWNGEGLRVLSPGNWNHGAGPDFRRARLELNGQPIVGDVEIHLYPEDWVRHGHDSNPEFDSVRLHVCVFPPTNPQLACMTTDGRDLPLWLMAPYLPEDLEHLIDHFREDDRQHWRMELQDAYATFSSVEVQQSFAALARDRFQAKVAFADWLVRRDGWQQACHELMLGYLGIPGNRAAMLSCAQQFGWQEMAADEFCISSAMDSFAGNWRKQSLRPANRPAIRLQQYCRVLREHRDWMGLWKNFNRQWMETQLDDIAGPGFRKLSGLMELRRWIRSELWAGVWTGTRFDSLVVDVLLPLKQSQSQRQDWFPVWFNWWSGDWPESYPQAIQELNLLPPLRRNGYCQGLFEWILNRQNSNC